MSQTFKLPAGHGTVLFEFTSTGLTVYTDCCGARVPRRAAKALRRLLKAYLKQS